MTRREAAEVARLEQVLDKREAKVEVAKRNLAKAKERLAAKLAKT